MEACEEEWKEWVSLKELTEQIPQQYYFGLITSSLSLTCLDAYHDHLVIGTNAGLVYLGHLPSFNLIRLKCENVSSPIQSVACVSSVDDMIAAGCHAGIITIFQIPSASALKLNNLTLSQGDNIPNNLTPQASSLQRFTVHIQVHKTPITALVWSRNGMRLFSGDKEGNVCLIEVDYEQQQCIGKGLIKVETRVVQLSYAHQMLAISHEERCLIYNLKDNCKIVVGKKPRNPPGLYGCAFSPSLELPKEDVLYCSRPSQRIWSANTTGEVLFSYIQKKCLTSSTMPLLDIPAITQPREKFSFGFLFHYKGSILVSYSGNSLIILNVDTQKVLGFCSDFVKICGVAVAGDNVFVLENHRSIICLSPHKPSFGTNRLFPSVKNSSNFLLQENLTPAALSEIKSKVILPNRHLIDSLTKLGGTVASKISEIATPTIIPGDKHTNENSTTANAMLSQHTEYQNQIHRPKPYFLGLSSKNTLHSSLIKDNGVSAPTTIPDASQVMTLKNDENDLKEDASRIGQGRKYDSVIIQNPKSKSRIKKKIDLSNEPKDEIGVEVREFNDDSRPYEVFKDAIEENESLLADVLGLTALRMDHKIKSTESLNTLQEDQGSDYQIHSEENQSPAAQPKGHFVSSLENEAKSSENSYLQSLSFGPPSGSSAANPSLDNPFLAQSTSKDGDTIPNIKDAFQQEVFIASQSIEGFQQVNTMPPPEDLPLGWQKHHLPSRPRGWLGYDNTILFSELNDLYFSNEFYPENQNLPSWIRKKLKLEVLSFYGFHEKLLLLTRQGHLLSLNRDKLLAPQPLRGSLVMEDKEILSAASDQNIIWILNRSGKLLARFTSENKQKEIEISCQELRLQSLICRSGLVWGLTTNGRIAYRIGVRPNIPTGIEWGIMLHPQKVVCIHLSHNGLGWMIDANGGLYVSLFVTQSYPQGLDGKWWQVGMSDYMLDETTPQPNSVFEEAPQIQMTSNEHCLWVSHTNSSFAFSHSLRSFVGHRWETLSESQFEFVDGGGIYKSFGTLYGKNQSGELFAINPQEDSILPLSLPSREKAISFSSRPETLWVLTRSGKIFIRTGLSGSASLGLKWVRLDLNQIGDIRLKHLSLSTEVVWAVDTSGQVYMRQGSVAPPNPKKKSLDPTWLHIDSNELKNGAVFEQVHVGNKSNLVWGLDTIGRIYVREAIFPDVSTGTSWVLVPGIYAQSLSISEDKVYAVTPFRRDETDASTITSGGQLYVREGISPTNYIGDSWERIPSNSILLKAVTASVDNNLWGLDNQGKIVKHSSLSLSDSSQQGNVPAEGRDFALSDHEDWEII